MRRANLHLKLICILGTFDSRGSALKKIVRHSELHSFAHQVTLNSSGVNYLGCGGKTASGILNCQLGQKFAVSVHDSVPTTAPTAASPVTQNNNNNSTVIAGLSMNACY